MENWQNFFLQRMGMDEDNHPYPVCESVSKWNVWCSEIPFKLFEKMKEPAKRTWFDQHGDDEYIPEGGLFAEAYEMTIKFGCRKEGTDDDVRENVASFLEYLRKSGMMKMYSSYTETGRQNVRLQSVSDNAKWKNENGEKWLVFGIDLKVNDPLTEIVPNEDYTDLEEDSNNI